jgi:hypothetical protein
MKLNSILSFLIILAFFMCGCQKKQSVLFANGETEYKIYFPGNAESEIIYSAELLAEKLKEISGADFDTVAKDGIIDKNQIVIASSYAKFIPEVPFAVKDDSEGFEVVTHNGDIYFKGGSGRAVMYAVYHFLEELLGCQWFSYDCVKIPELNRWKVPQISYYEEPAFSYRAIDYCEAYRPEFSLPRKINSQRFNRSRQPGGYERFWLEHSFEIFLPPDVFFNEHPEYFSLRDGQRKREKSQLCLTNTDVLKIITRRTKEFIRQNPDYRIYNVAQNDNQNYCTCKDCKAIVDEQESESGLMLWFVNQVAEKVKEEFPDKYIGTFAYQYTRKPPKNIVPDDNVYVILCSIECDFSHPFSHPNNEYFLRDLKQWSDIAPNIFIWDYVVNYRHYLIPHPNFGILQDNIRILKDHQVTGVLAQANYQSLGGEFARLRSYLLAKLLWNPQMDINAEIDNFINNYYGSSAGYVMEYFDLVQSLVNEQTQISFATKLTNPIYSSEFIKEARTILDKAIESADNELIRTRVEEVELGILYMEIINASDDAVKSGKLKKFLKIAKERNITMTSEGTTIEEFEQEFSNKSNVD